MAWIEQKPVWHDDYFSERDVNGLLGDVYAAVIGQGYSLERGSIEDEVVLLRHPTIAGRTIELKIDTAGTMKEEDFFIRAIVNEEPENSEMVHEFLATDGPEKRVDLAYVLTWLTANFLPETIWGE